MSDCLDALVGLSDNDCNCYTDSRPATYDTSDSGYYLTDADEGFNILEAIAQGIPCGDSSIWDALTTSRSKAIVRLRTDFIGKLREHRKPRLRNFNDVIGKITANQIVSTAFPYAGVKLIFQDVKGGSFYIDELFVGLDTTTALEVKITSNDPQWTDVTISGTTEAGVFKAFTPSSVPVQIPMHSSLVLNNTGDERLEYYIWYQIPEGAQPLANRWVCCGKRPSWKAHLDISGFTTNTITPPIESGGGGTAMGIAIRGYFQCDDMDYFCSLDKDAGVNFRNIVARSIQAKGSAYLLNYVLNKQDVSQYTLMNREEMHDKRVYLEQRYNDYLDWMVDNYPSRANDCYVCAKKIERKEFLV